MFRVMCRSKIHRVRITDLHLNYEGSIGIDEELLEEADILPGERVQVVNIQNGARFETYVIPEERGSGVVSLNGAAARLGEVGDLVIVLSYGVMSDDEARGSTIRVVHVDDHNRALPKDKGET